MTLVGQFSLYRLIKLLDPMRVSVSYYTLIDDSRWTIFVVSLDKIAGSH
jgi:hypothetical protein